MSETKTTTMFQIEREARWRVWALFALLLFMVYVCIWVVVMAIEFVVEVSMLGTETNRHFLAFSLSPRGAVLIFLVSALVALFYWYVSRIGARDHMVRVMHAQPLDPDDRFHQRLADIVEEMRIATGGPAIRCLTVATAGMNAFAFSDLHGGACIGVTEGALSRLSRQQLEGVVAHEFGHILSGDYVTVTSACLLFGVYTSLGGALDDAMGVGPSRARGSAAHRRHRLAGASGSPAGRLGGDKRRHLQTTRVGRRSRRRALHARPAEPRPGAGDDGQTPGRRRLHTGRAVGALHQAYRPVPRGRRCSGPWPRIPRSKTAKCAC